MLVLSVCLLACSDGNEIPSLDIPPNDLDQVAPDDPQIAAAGIRPIISGLNLKDVPQYQIHFDLSKDMTEYSGEETIFLPNRTEGCIKSIGLYLLPEMLGGHLVLTSVKQNGHPVTYKNNAAVCQIKLMETVLPAAHTIITVGFKGKIPLTHEGPGMFFFQDDTVCLGGFYPGIIPFRKDGTWRPSIPQRADYYDPPEILLASYLVRFSAPAEYRFASTGLLSDGEKNGDKRIYTAVSGPVREFFLAGSKQWNRISLKLDDIAIHSYYPPQNMFQGINAVYYAADTLKIFQKKFGPYPYSEFDIVCAPMGSYGIGTEFPGIIVLNSNLYNPEGIYRGVSSDFMLEAVTAHEIAHQWFYNLVGNDPVEEPWLDESLAQYSMWLYLEESRGKNSGSFVYAGFEYRWERIKRKMIPIGFSSGKFKALEYAPIIYGRAPLFIFELIRVFGQDRFDAFLSDYISRFKWKQVSGEDFRDLMKIHFGDKGIRLFDEWVRGIT